MTSRPRPTTHSRTWDDRERRTMLLNIGFGLTIVAALLLLLIAWGVSWYNDHLSAAGTVNGQTITKDAWSKQVAINEFRADYQQRRIRTLLAAGQISAADAESRNAFLDQRLQQVDSLSLEQLVDGTIQAELAPSQGVTVTPADIDAALTEEATTPELRHAWMIAVEPELADGASEPTDEAIAAARAKADKALADLKAGKDWETVAKAVSTDASKDQAGDLGFIDENAALDAAFLAGLMAAAKDAPTEVVEGADGIFRIGRVTEIVAPVVDTTLAGQIADAGIGIDDFRAALGRDVTRTKLERRDPRRAPGPGPAARGVRDLHAGRFQRDGPDRDPGPPHPLLAQRRRRGRTAPVPDDDPAWAKAEAEAKATWEKLKTDPSQFDSIARAESDEDSAVTTGGKLPYFSTDDQLDQDFAAAIFKPGLQPGQLLDPVKTEFGWHVIQVMHDPTDVEWADKLTADIDAGTLTFADAARDNSDNAEAAEGGDIGWIGKGQLDEAQEAAIFAAPDRQGQRAARRPGRGHLPVPRGQGGDPRAGRRAARDPRELRLPALVLAAEGRVRDHPRRQPSPARRADAARSGRADAGRAPRRGPAALGPRSGGRPRGRRRRAARRHARRAVAPGAGRAGGTPAGGPAGDRRRFPRPCRAATARAAATRSPSCAACTRRTTRWAGSAAPRGRRSGPWPRTTSPARCTSRRSRPSPTPPRRGACPGSRTGSGRPTAAPGTASRRTSRCATTCSRRRTRSTTRSRPAPRRSSPASSATCCSRSSSTRSSPPRRACST